MILDNRNLSMLMDFYELTMGNGYLEHGMEDTIGIFDMYYRSVPDDGGFAISSGLASLIEYFQRPLPRVFEGLQVYM